MTLSIFSIGLLMILSACKTSDTANAYQEDSDSCSESFIDDYDVVHDSLRDLVNSQTQEKVDIFEKNARAFRKKYSGVNCLAMIREYGESSYSEEYIDVNNEIDGLLETFAPMSTRERTGKVEGYSLGLFCSQSLLDDSKNISDTARKIDIQSSTSIQIFRDLVMKFKDSYLGVKCIYIDSEDTKQKFDVNSYSEKLISLTDQLVEDLAEESTSTDIEP